MPAAPVSAMADNPAGSPLRNASTSASSRSRPSGASGSTTFMVPLTLSPGYRVAQLGHQSLLVAVGWWPSSAMRLATGTEARMLSDTSRHGRLQDIQALTDAALARLSYDDFLTELLERTRDVLRADTAAVLLLDRGQLVATAAIGLEEEVLQGVRMPLGRGFAGRIAAERRAVIVDDLDDRTMKESLLLQGSGIRSLVGVPLIAAGQLLGVLRVGSLAARTFGPEDVELLQLAAERAALAVQAKLSREDRIAATALQRSLLPSALPQVAGIDIAARHVAGQGVVGGDWYDVFQLPTGELGVAIGDVAGSGLEAAVIMGRVRSALRSYALDTRDPAEVLARLDRKMQHFEPDSIATVMYGVFDAA